jgi:hypothetical protein
MTPEENDLIVGLFSRLRSADSPDKDRDAEALINRGVQQLPSAPYLLVQTLLVQEHALTNAQARIADLEQQLQQARQSVPATQSQGSFLDRAAALGPWNRTQAPAPAYQAPTPGYASTGAYQQPPYPTTATMAPSAGGGFLRSALTTAAGVAGGALLFEGISGLLGHNSGPFGGGYGGGFGGGFGGGYAPTEEIIENNTTFNNYYGSDSADSSGSGSNDASYDQASDYDSGGDFGSSDDSGFA